MICPAKASTVESATNDFAIVTTESPEQTQAVGRVIGEHARAGDVFLLSGELGAGKTCLTQGILWGMGGEEYARSPTFVLICEYPARLTLYHMDLYRLDNIDEIVDLGLEDYFLGDGVCVVEWAEKGLAAFVGEHLLISIVDVGSESRRMTFSAKTSRYSQTLGALREQFPSEMSVSHLQSASNEAK